MAIDPIIQQATADIGGFTLTAYRDKRGVLSAANAVSALGAWAGAFAQVQARAMLMAGIIPQTQSSLLEVKTTDGASYFFGDAINACLMEGDARSPSFWKMVAPIAGDADIAAKVDVVEIARHTSAVVGSAPFGKPRIDARYRLTEQPIEAVRRHGPVLLRRIGELQLQPTKLMTVFGSVAQSFAGFAAGQIKDVPVDVAMKGHDIVRLYMESAVPMSKLDLPTVGMRP